MGKTIVSDLFAPETNVIKWLHALRFTGSGIESSDNGMLRVIHLLLRRTRSNDNDIALSGFSVLSGSHASARVTMISGIAEILNLSVAKLSLGVY